MARPKLDRLMQAPGLRMEQFTCERCTLLSQCESCRAMERAFLAAPDITNWEAWARDQAVDPEPKRLLVALAHRVDEHGFVQDGLSHFARDAGLPKYEGDNEELWNKQELACARWAWRQLRELMAAGYVEIRWTPTTVSVDQQSHSKAGWSRDRYGVEVKWSYSDLPLSILWVRLKSADAPRVWRRVA